MGARFRFGWLWGLVLVVLWPGPAPGAAPARHQVLVMFDEDNDLPGMASIQRGLRQALVEEFGDDIGFYTESLQLTQFRDRDSDSILSDFLGRKYQGERLDLIIAVMEPSLDFLLRHRESLFAGTPIVFCGLDSTEVADKPLPADVTGVMMKRRFAPTVDTVLALKPDTRRLFVVGGSSRFDRRLQGIARRDLEAVANRIEITWLTTLPMQELLATVSDLPPNSAVFYLTLFVDGSGQPFVTHDALKRVVEAANAPVYVSLDQYVGTGAVGGNVYSVESLGVEAARVAGRVLRGAAPSSIPPQSLAPYKPVFDWRQLQRWDIPLVRLPEDSVVQFRRPGAWQTYRWYIFGGVSLFLLQSALVIALLVNRAQRRRAEVARQESEQRRRHAEEEAQRQREELAHTLRLTTLGELTASIAHELNQPLTAIAANAQAAKRLLNSDPASPDLPEALEDLEDDSIRAAEIIQRLQALFRKKPATHALLDVNSVIDDVLRLLGADLRHRQIQVTFARSNVAPRVQGDGVQLRQVIINLIRNAEDAIAAAGDGPRAVNIAVQRPDASCIVIEIRDSGIGVENDDALERIFEHFVSSKPQGLGMGLAISRSLVEAHGGKIWATRNADRGLTLHVRLPLAAGDSS
jgi:signal transduction histidine kinase